MAKKKAKAKPERIHHGDSREWLQGLKPDSFAACITDPPYELGFMGKAWDKRGIASDPDFWRKVFRVLKPGAHLAAFGGTRTHHRIMCAIEDAGFEIRDCLMWIYGQGFPKSHNVSKAIDKAVGAVREVVGENPTWRETKRTQTGMNPVRGGGAKVLTANATPEAEAWDGWGTALKPSFEPIILARKPFKGTVAANVLEHGTGAVNIDACRTATENNLGGGAYAKNGNRADLPGAARSDAAAGMMAPGKTVGREFQQPKGRWPANVILQHSPECVCVGTRTVKTGTTVTKGRTPDYDASSYKIVDTRKGNGGYGGDDRSETIDRWACVPGCPVRMIDQQSGQSRSAPGAPRSAKRGNGYRMTHTGAEYTDAGGASRFVYNAKANKAERSAGLPKGERNLHPTVKPIAVMRWLVRLLTPPGGRILEPFAGSGTTCCACELEGVDYKACEKEKAHVRVARLRAKHWKG